MGGDAELHQRSSSPLKRPASSMEPDLDAHMGDEVDLVPSQPPHDGQDVSAAGPSDVKLPRAMSVDVEPVADMGSVIQMEGRHSLRHPDLVLSMRY